MTRHSKQRCANRHGVAIVYVSLIMLVLIGVMGLGIDSGYVYVTGHQLQNAADAAALAGANEVVFDKNQAATDAITQAAKNKAAQAVVNLNPADVFVGNYDTKSSTFTANKTPLNACKVIARRTTTLFFGRIFGQNTSDVSRTAIAMNSTISAAIILLSSNASPALQLSSNGAGPKVSLNNGGAVVINSTSNTAVQWNRINTQIIADELDIGGNEPSIQTSGVFPSGTLNFQSPAIPDPLASLPVPAKGTDRSKLKKQPKGGWPSGHYPKGLPAGKLAGGIYYVDGGIDLKNNESINGLAGAMIYLASGGIKLASGATITVNAMTTGPYAGISYFEARSNGSDIELNGDGNISTTGTLYFPNGDVTIGGDPTTFGNQLIANTLNVVAGAQFNIDYDGRNTSPRYRAYLVN